jgi:hypothetical protein
MIHSTIDDESMSTFRNMQSFEQMSYSLLACISRCVPLSRFYNHIPSLCVKSNSNSTRRWGYLSHYCLSTYTRCCNAVQACVHHSSLDVTCSNLLPTPHPHLTLPLPEPHHNFFAPSSYAVRQVDYGTAPDKQGVNKCWANPTAPGSLPFSANFISF